MRSGIGFPSLSGAALAMVTGSASADFPVANLADKQNIRRVFRASAAGAVSLTFTMPAAGLIRLLAILHHNAPLGATFRWRLFSAGAPDPTTNAANLCYDSGVTAFYGPGITPNTDFPACRPFLLDGDRSVYSGRLDLSSNSAPWEIGALEFSGWWEWPNVQVPREFGLDPKDVVIEAGEGADHAMPMWSPRVWRGSRDIDVTEEQALCLDFQFAKGRRRPFVFLWDYDDEATWARECVLMKNASLPKLSKLQHPLGLFAFDFVEYLR